MPNQTQVKVQFFTPEVFSVGIAITSSVATFPETFAINRAIFSKKRYRHSFIRQESGCEFDLPISDKMPDSESVRGMYLQRPKLWIAVFGDDNYQLNIPVFRSGCADPFFPTELVAGYQVAITKDDEAVQLLLVEMQRRGGVEVAEFKRWLGRWQQEWNKLISNAANAQTDQTGKNPWTH